ncbi:single-stranded DNA-binding protein [Streptomyces sp. BI20]|uniref:single-stranded DNA-binding protein n=1 Tax=Streptomyces sp. BI20 TaxID=3403460 RepID=UPI003C7909FE
MWWGATYVTLVGCAATAVDFRDAPSGPLARFRLAVSPRVLDRRSDTWSSAPTSFYTVWIRRALARHAASSVSIGDPLVVHGSLRVWSGRGEERGGAEAVVDAMTVGHDLSRGTSAFRRAPGRSAAPAPLTEVQKGSVG